jgi:hypothetical protein
VTRGVAAPGDTASEAERSEYMSSELALSSAWEREEKRCVDRGPNQFKSLLGVGEGFRSKPGRAVRWCSYGRALARRDLRASLLPPLYALFLLNLNLRGICGCFDKCVSLFRYAI